MRSNIQMALNPYATKLKEDREADLSVKVFKNIPLLVVATLVALPITFFILMYIVNTLVTLTQLYYARF